MTTKKSSKKTPVTKKKPGKTTNIKTSKINKTQNGSPLLRSLLGLTILITIVVSTFVTVHYLFPPELTPPSSSATRYEVFPEEKYDYPAHDYQKPPGESRKLPQVALIIDDVGYNKRIANQFADLDSNLTFSVLPNSPHRRIIAKNAHKKGLEIMLHLPMEPIEYPKINPGPNALLVSMSPDELTDNLKNHIASIPYIKGVNNHMGSRMTALSSKMYQIFVVLKKEDLFFIDSRTSAQSLCKPSARLLQIPFAQRDVFLDHLQTPKAVKRQINLLITHAEKYGSAIGIGHPHEVTYNVLKESLENLKSRVKIVHASSLVKPLGQDF